MGQLTPGETDAPDDLELGPLRVGQTDYALDDWSSEGRGLLDRLLTANEVRHAWQGATLSVRSVDEDRVDHLIEEVEAAVLPTLDPDADRIVYEVAEWSVDRRAALGDALDAAEVRYEWDGMGDLVVESGDEQRVDRLVDGLGDEEPEEPSGPDATTVLSDLFVAVDRLRRNPRDHRGVLGAAEAGRALGDLGVPFGYDRAGWREVQAVGARLVATIEDDAVADDELRELAAELTEQLRPLV